MSIFTELSADYSRLRSHKPSGWRILLAALMYAGFRAIFLYRVARWFRVRRLPIVAAVIDRFSWHATHCAISSSAKIGKGFLIAHAGGITIGSKVVIGDFCDIRQNTTFGGSNGKKRVDDLSWTQPHVGNRVSVGCHAALLGPILIADDVLVAAGAIVIRDVSTNDVVGGVPAKSIKNNRND